MLRDDIQVALNDVIGLCEAAAEAYERAAELAEDDQPLPAFFRAYAAERRKMAAELREDDRRLGDIPHAPDPDRSAARDVLGRLRAAFSRDHLQALIEDCEQAEQALTAGLSSVLSLGIPADMRENLGRMRYDVTAAIGRLAAEKARL